MTITHAFASFALVAGLLTVIPGLDTAFVLRTAVAHGRRPAFAAALGIATGALIWGMAAATGVSVLLTASQTAYLVLRIAGAAYLVWFGGTLVRDAVLRRGGAVSVDESPQAAPRVRERPRQARDGRGHRRRADRLRPAAGHLRPQLRAAPRPMADRGDERPERTTMTSLPATLEAVVFDCDGLLAETESGWSRAETAVFAEHGFPFGPAEKQLLIGKTLASAGVAMAEYFGLPGRGPELAERLAGLVWKELSAGTPALPGARELASRLRERGIPVAVASNSSGRFVAAALESAGLDDLFEVVVSADDVERPKPAPDLYLRACELLGADPARAVAFEDSGTGAASARAAGMFVVGVPSLPSSRLEVDALFVSLAEPGLREWADSCRSARS